MRLLLELLLEREATFLSTESEPGRSRLGDSCHPGLPENEANMKEHKVEMTREWVTETSSSPLHPACLMWILGFFCLHEPVTSLSLKSV